MNNLFVNISKRYSPLWVAALIILIAISYTLIANRISISHHYRLNDLSTSLERDDWKVYPLGCHLIQLPDEYTILVRLGLTYGSTYSIVHKPNSDDSRIEKMKTASTVYGISIYPHHWTTKIDTTEDFYHLNAVNSKTSGIVFRNYYHSSSRRSKERIHTLKGVLVLPPIPTDERVGILFKSFNPPGSKEVALFPEIIKTFRTDQRLFGELIRQGGEQDPFATNIDEIEAFELRSFTVEEFNAIPGEMDQTPYRRLEDLDCGDFRLGIPPPEYWVRNAAGQDSSW